MRRGAQLVLAAAVAALVASPALAQRGPRGGRFGGIPGLFLLRQKSVQEELKLTDDQVKKVTEAASKQGEARLKIMQEVKESERPKKFQELAKEGDKAIANILTKDQADRLAEIRLQRRGALAIADPSIAQKLGLTDDQKNQVKEIVEAAAKQREKIVKDAGGIRRAYFPKIQEYMKTVGDKLMKMLTDDQKAKWKAMTGKPFKG
jgi:Spy/CpxP family protein refolding chaperone